jgi:hypothetical protein
MNVELSKLYFDTGLTILAFEADICAWWKGIPIQWFSEFLFDIFFRVLAIDFVVLIHVVGLIHQIIELGKYRDDSYCKSLIWDLKNRWGDINLFLPSPSQKTPIPVAIEVELC